MLRLGQASTAILERLALFGCGDTASNFCYLIALGIDKITTKGPPQWHFNGWTFYSFTQTLSFGFLNLFIYFY
jgi:hypothetical protein